MYPTVTYKTAQIKNIFQLYVIQGRYRGRILPLGFALMKRKRKRCYTILFNAIADRFRILTGRILAPRLTVTDFEVQKEKIRTYTIRQIINLTMFDLTTNIINILCKKYLCSLQQSGPCKTFGDQELQLLLPDPRQLQLPDLRLLQLSSRDATSTSRRPCGEKSRR